MVTAYGASVGRSSSKATAYLLETRVSSQVPTAWGAQRVASRGDPISHRSTTSSSSRKPIATAEQALHSGGMTYQARLQST